MDNNAKNKKQPKLFGLLGKNISYSFSSSYFSEKFAKLGLLNYTYVNFDITTISAFKELVTQYKEHLVGMNVTIPYKEVVLPFLDEMDAEAQEIGAVNTIKVLAGNRLKGYNTDIYGFEHSLQPLLKNHHKKALILGTGGASKAIAHSFKKNNIDFLFVSRNPSKHNAISYADVNEEVLSNFSIIVNCTPVGTFPNVAQAPEIPYQYLTAQHLLFDLIYNPEETHFLQLGKLQGAVIKNGYEMLELQAEKAWEIWNL